MKQKIFLSRQTKAINETKQYRGPDWYSQQNTQSNQQQLQVYTVYYTILNLSKLKNNRNRTATTPNKS